MLFLHRAGGKGGILVVAHHGHLAGLFLHMAVGFGHTVKAAGNVIIAAHVLHQVFGHSGQAVGILNVFIVIVCVQKCRVLPLADQRDSRFVQMQFIHSTLLQAAQAAFAGKLGGAAAHSQWNGLRVQRFVAALADLQQDILLEIGQRGNEALDPQSVPLAMRRRATQLASESGLSGLKQCAVDELHLNEAGITLVCKGEHTAFLYADYNYENIEDTDCLPAVAEYLVQHMRGYYNITRSFYSVPKANGHVEEKTREVTVVRHHEDTPFAPGPVQKQHLF